jgi:hypothetical protein
MTYDIDLLKTQTADDLTGFDFRESGSLTSSRTKVIKRFVQLLLTVQGSDKTDPHAGCSLLTDIVGITLDAAAITLLARNAVDLCTEQIRRDQPAETPAHEMLSYVTVVDAVFGSDNCDLTLEFTFTNNVAVTTSVTLDLYG